MEEGDWKAKVSAPHEKSYRNHGDRVTQLMLTWVTLSFLEMSTDMALRSPIMPLFFMTMLKFP